MARTSLTVLALAALLVGTQAAGQRRLLRSSPSPSPSTSPSSSSSSASSYNADSTSSYSYSDSYSFGNYVAPPNSYDSSSYGTGFNEPPGFFTNFTYNIAPPAPNCSTATPAACMKPGIPLECYGSHYSGNQWSNSHVECHVCPKNNWQLTCDYSDGLLSKPKIKCSFDKAGLSSITNKAYDFACPVNTSADPQNMCDWSALEKNLPGCALEPVRRILVSWNATKSSWSDWWYTPTFFNVPNGTCSNDNPAGCIETSVPDECSGNLFSGNKWSGSDIECHVCSGDNQLKCDLDTAILFGHDTVNCKLDKAGLASLVNNAYDFSCKLNYTAVPPNQCDWAQLASDVPGCALEPVRRILATWNPVS